MHLWAFGRILLWATHCGLPFSILFLSLCQAFFTESSFLMLQTRAAVVGVSSGFSRSHWIACFIFSFSGRSRRSVFLGALRRRAMVLKVEIILSALHKLIYFFVWESHINLKSRCAMRDNLLFPTKGKGPLGATLSPTITSSSAGTQILAPFSSILCIYFPCRTPVASSAGRYSLSNQSRRVCSVCISTR